VGNVKRARRRGERIKKKGTGEVLNGFNSKKVGEKGTETGCVSISGSVWKKVEERMDRAGDVKKRKVGKSLGKRGRKK